MFIGHNAVGFIAKRLAPEVSLGTLFMAVQFPDLVWPILLLSGQESVKVVQGSTHFLTLDFTYYPFSHSLAGCAVMGVVLGLLWRAFAKQRSWRGFAVVALAVVSHWVLDWIVHIPDLPLTMQGESKFGLGLWKSVPSTIAVELILFAVCVYSYVKGTVAKSPAGKWSLWSFVAFLLLLYIGNAFGPPPPNERIVAYLGLSAWLMVFWGYWIDMTRKVSGETAQEPSPAL